MPPEPNVGLFERGALLFVPGEKYDAQARPGEAFQCQVLLRAATPQRRPPDDGVPFSLLRDE